MKSCSSNMKMKETFLQDAGARSSGEVNFKSYWGLYHLPGYVQTRPQGLLDAYVPAEAQPRGLFGSASLVVFDALEPSARQLIMYIAPLPRRTNAVLPGYVDHVQECGTDSVDSVVVKLKNLKRLCLKGSTAHRLITNLISIFS